MLLEHIHTVELVHDVVIVHEPKGKPEFKRHVSQSQPVAYDGDERAQVELHNVVELIDVVKVAIRGEVVEDPVEELHKGEITEPG